MTARVHALPIPGTVREVRASAYILPDGRPGLFWTGHGIGHGAYRGVELYGVGSAGSVRRFAVLDGRGCRELAAALELEAARLDATHYPGRQW